MPKLIPELRKQFLEAARNQVLVQDRDFTVRQIASDCGVSVGTLYNYFPSKEALIGAVMMEDWMLCRERMAQASEGKEDILEALRAVEAALRLLMPLGVCTICAYPGHAAGDEERQRLMEYLSALRPQEFNVLHQRFLNAGNGAPECFVIQKQGGG